MQLSLDNHRYPIGDFVAPKEFTQSLIDEFISEIEALPLLLKETVKDLTDKQLDTPYREGGWTVRQVVHHLADSHINSYIRFKLAMTEELPTIKPYQEELWALTPDGQNAAIQISLPLIEALHHRWVMYLKTLTISDLERKFYHPQSQKEVSLYRNLAIYAWHGKHHVAQIQSLKIRMGWI